MADDFRIAVDFTGESVGGRNHRARPVCLLTHKMIDV